jgi:very-short-patch-repair endonuclease
MAFEPVSTTRALIQVASTFGIEAGVVAADAALLAGRCTVATLRAELHVSPAVRGRWRATAMVEAVDPRCESVGESRLRLLLRGAGLPVRTQVRIGDDSAMVARVDLVVGDRVVVEFDGAVKYAGDASGRALFEEKRREDRLRELGFEVVRVTWGDLDPPDRVLVRVRSALARAHRRRPS